MKFSLESFTLFNFLKILKKNYGSKNCLSFVNSGALTYEQFYNEVFNLILRMTRIGVRKKERILIYGKGSINWCAAYFACAAMGAVPVLIHDKMNPSIFKKVYGKAVCKYSFIDDDLYQTLKENKIVHCKYFFNLTDLELFEGEEKKKGNESTFRKGVVERYCLEVEKDDIACIFYTAGTTDIPKACVFTHQNILSAISNTADNFHFFNDSTRALLLLSPAHLHGFMQGILSVFYSGGTVFFSRNISSKKMLFRDINKLKPSLLIAHNSFYEYVYKTRVVTILTGQMFHHSLSRAFFTRKYLYRRLAHKFSKVLGKRMECLLVLGARFIPELEFFFIESRLPFAYAYTIQENASPVTLQDSQFYKSGSSGKALENQKVTILNPDEETGIGQVAVRSPSLMKGYKKKLGIMRTKINNAKWFLTGDRGFIDRSDNLYISGRGRGIRLLNDVVIFPEEIEDFFREEHYVKEVKVHLDHDLLIAEIFPDYGYISHRLEISSRDTLELQVEKVMEQLRNHVNIKLPFYYQVSRIKIRRVPFEKTPFGSIII